MSESPFNLEARYSASIIDFEKATQRLVKQSRNVSDRIAADQNRTSKGTKTAWEKADIGGALNKSLGTGMAGVSSQLAKLAPMLAAAFAGNAAIGAMDTYNRFSNQLKVAGLEGSKLAAVQEHLYQTALKNGSALEPLGTLYSRVSQSAKELGLSQSGILNITDAVASAIKISGGTAETASGAMLQLSQALGSGTVHAEEFNSINEGLLPLLQAAAAASDKYGGSVAKMKADVVKGGLASAEFARLIQEGMTTLEEKAAKASLTVGQATTNIQTALIKGISTIDQTYGATEKLTGAITWLSQNLDGLGKSLLVLAGIYAVSAAPAIGRAALALVEYSAGAIGAGLNTARLTAFQVGMTASMRGTTVAAESATVAMRGLMSATGIGLAIVAVTTALGLFANEAIKAAEAERQFDARIEEGRQSKAKATKASYDHRLETGKLTKAEVDALTHVAALTGQTNLLADAHGRAALEAKRQALAEADLAIRKAQTDDTTAKGNLRSAQDAQGQVDRNRQRQASNGNMRFAGTDIYGAEAAAPHVAKDLTKAKDQAGVAADVLARAKAEKAELAKALAETFVTKPTATVVAKPDKGAAGKERRGDTAIESADSDLRGATKALAYTMEERHAAALVALQDERDAHIRKLDEAVQDKQLAGPDAEIAKGKYREAYNAKVKAENAEYQRQLDERARELSARDLDTTLERLRVEEDELKSLADHSRTIKDKQIYEASALAKRQEADRLSFAASQEQLRLDLQKLGLTKAEIDGKLAAKQSVFDTGQKNDRGDLVADQRKETPGWGDWLGDLATSADSLDQKLQGVAAGGLQSLTDGITNAVMGSGSLKDAFADTIKSMIANLIKLGVQFLIFEALGRAFGVPGLGKIAIGMNKHASGTNFAPGGLSIVGEKGPELLNLPRGTQVGANNLLRNALQTPRGSNARGGDTYHFHTTVNADNAVMRSDIDRQIYNAQTQTFKTVRQTVPKDTKRSSDNALR
jgi:tape measure domain-containing protein